MQYRTCLFCIIIASLCFLGATSSLAADGTIQGYVSGPDGVNITGATITGPNSSTTTDGSGFYTMSHPAGVHSFTASASGFISKTINNVTISDGFVTNLDFSLSEMEVQSSYPSLGTLGQSLPIEINGAGFDTNTRFALLPDTGNAFSEVGRYTNPDLFKANAVKKVDDIVYIVDLIGSLNPLFPAPGEPEYLGTLYIVDVSNPTKPQELGSIALPGYGRDIDVNGSYAYVTYGDYDTGEGGMIIIDVSDFTHPQLKGSVPLNVAYGVEVQGSVAYVIDGNCEDVGSYTKGGQLRAIDVSSVNTPTLSWSLGLTTQIDGSDPVQYESFCALGLDVQNDKAYIANEWGGLQIIDIKPGSASYQTAFYTPISGQAEFMGVKVVGNWAFTAVENDGLQIYDVTDPANPILTGSADTPGLARDIDVVDDIAYVADYVGGLLIFDVQDKSAPVLLGPIDSDGAALDVIVEGSLAYVAADWYSLQILDVSNPQKPTLAGSITNIEGQDVLKEGDTLYITDSDGLHIINVATPTAPTISSSIPFDDGAGMRMVKKGNTMYVASYSVDLKVVDLLTSVVTSVDISNGSNRSWAVDVDDSFIYLADGNCDMDTTTGGLTLIDITNTANQQRVDLGGCVTDVVVDSTNKLAYVTISDDPSGAGYDGDDEGLKVIDVDPTHVTPSPTVFLDTVDFISLPGDPLGLTLFGNYAYVASDWEGLQILDITTPSNLQLIASTGTLGHEAQDVKLNVSGTTAYVADKDAGVYIVDLNDPANPVVECWVDTPGFANNLVFDDWYAYVADSFAGLTIVPLPYVFSHSFVNEWKVTATLPSPPIDGHYRIRAFHNTKSSDSVIDGAVTFVDPARAPDLLTTKAIILAGGGDYSDNLIWEETKAYANQAYDNLIYQGYRHEDIRYLTDEPDPLARYGEAADAANNVRTATKTNVQNAITVWAQSGTGDLLLFMEDHGESQSFLMQGGTIPEYLTADELDTWLDDLQLAKSNTVIVAYDACLSGSFINKLRPPAGKTRVVMTSSGRDQIAYFLSENHSFSSHFWSTFSGRTGSKAKLSLAYNRAANLMSAYQSAQLDANGNGVPNEAEDFTALQGFEGTIHAGRRQFSSLNRTKPVIAAVAQDQVVLGSSAMLSTSDVYDIDGDQITRVWAEIVAPDFYPDPAGKTVVDLPEIPLSGPDGNGDYQRQHDFFTVNGTYIITYYAEDSSGIYSLPKTSLVTQAGGTTNIPPDQYEDDDTRGTAQSIFVDHPIPQNHTFHDIGDQDWVKFYGIGGKLYNIRAMNPTLISDPVVSLYNGSGVLLQTSNTSGTGLEESIIGWNCPTNDTYYVRVTNNSSYFGANVRYKLWVYDPGTLSLPDLDFGIVSGSIVSGGVGVAGALVSTPGAQPQYTNGSGGFALFLPAGTHTVTATLVGYQSVSFQVTVGSGQEVSVAPVSMNAAPRFNTFPPTSVEAFSSYYYTPSVVDPEGDSYTFSISGKPSWATFNSSTGQLSGRPVASDIGKYGPIVIRVTDSKGASNSISFTITVTEGSGGGLPGIFMLLLK